MKFRKGLRLRLEFAALWLAVVIARAMPVQAASWLSGKLWRLIAPRLSRQTRALANLELAYPEKSPRERKVIAAAMWENLGRTFAESLCIKALTKSDRIVFEPPGSFDEAARGAKPFIVCGLHLGNWEILAHGGQRLGVSLIGVYQRISNPHVETLMRSLREPLYKAGLTPKTPMAARVLLRAIKDGASPCFLADLRDHNGPFVPFFGQPARCRPLVFTRASSVFIPAVPPIFTSMRCTHRLYGVPLKFDWNASAGGRATGGAFASPPRERAATPLACGAEAVANHFWASAFFNANRHAEDRRTASGRSAGTTPKAVRPGTGDGARRRARCSSIRFSGGCGAGGARCAGLGRRSCRTPSSPSRRGRPQGAWSRSACSATDAAIEP
jgi:Kdo2-lipid IVA lauroyltransferase/acyltransferase